MKKAIAVGFLFFSFAVLTQAQQQWQGHPAYGQQWSGWETTPAPQSTWQGWQIQTQTPYQNNYLLQQYYSPQNQAWQQLQQWNTFQQQYRSNYNPYDYRNSGRTPSANYMYQNGYEPEVYAPQIYEPGGNVILEPGDEDY